MPNKTLILVAYAAIDVTPRSLSSLLIFSKYKFNAAKEIYSMTHSYFPFLNISKSSVLSKKNLFNDPSRQLKILSYVFVALSLYG